MLREKFPEFCSSPSPPVEGMGPSHSITCLRRGTETPRALSLEPHVCRLGAVLHLCDCPFQAFVLRFLLNEFLYCLPWFSLSF